MKTPLSLALYVLLAAASLQPQLARPGETIAYVGDSLESVYIVAWNVRQFFADPLRLFEANVLHPVPSALAYTDHRLLPSLLAAPVVWTTGNAVLGYNFALVVVLVFAAEAGRRLGLALGLSPLAAWAAGALYAFHTYQINEAPRLNIVAHGFLPLALRELLHLLQTGRRAHAWSCGGYMLMQGLSSNYHLLYGTLLLGLVLVMASVVQPRAVRRALPPLFAAALAGAVCFAPIAWPYLKATQAQGLSRALPAGVDVQHWFSTAPGNVWYGPIGAPVRLQQQGPHFVGFIALGLSALAVAALLRRGGPRTAEPEPPMFSGKWVGAAAFLALTFVALSLGRDVVVWGREVGPGPYRLLFDYVPGFRLVRIPERLALLAMLFVGLLAGRGLDWLRSRLPSRLAPAVTTALALALPLEHLSLLPAERVPAGRQFPAVYAWLASAPVRAYAELPVRGEALIRQETLEMYFSTASWRPVIHGYTAYPPLVTRVLRRASLRFPDDATLAAYDRVGVDTVVVHEGRPLGVDLGNQLATRGEPAEELKRLLALTGQDLPARLEAALAAGRIERVARFAGPAARLFQSEADTVYRVLPGRRPAPAPFPAGTPRRDPSWRYRAKAGQPERAADGDLATTWNVPRRLRGDEFWEVSFGTPVRISGLVLRLNQASAWPTRFKIGARDVQGRWSDAAYFGGAHELQLLDSVLRDPRNAAIGFDLAGREATALIVQVVEGGTSEEGWNVPEIEVLVGAEAGPR